MACIFDHYQSVNPTGPGLTIEGYRASCSCGWRTDLFPYGSDAWEAVYDHLGEDSVGAEPKAPH